ncbi:mitoguardin 1 isoform X2 [Hyperolius riggenbachi]|uniref:mitoguardin 1 isoform X2 n=1 Tax=Hyperolius riggenbachi TaxID=752182 RepID=UPI0035A3D561
MASLEDAMPETQHPIAAAAWRLAEFPLSCYKSVTQLKSSLGLKKILVVTALGAAVGTVSVVFLAHHFKRRRGRKKTAAPSRQPCQLLLGPKTGALEKDSSCSSSKQNLTLSLNSGKEKGNHLHINGGLYSNFSGSVQSLSSVRSVNSCHSCLCGNSTSWDKAEEDDDMKLVNIPVTTPENLYLMGMELFEEALRRWEQALTFRNRQAEDEANCGSVRLGAGDAIAEENVEDIISAEFIRKLESLLQRAYRLQEEFEASLGASDPASLANGIDKETDVTVLDNGDDFCTRDTESIASTDSFASAAELSERRDIRGNGLQSLYQCPLYEEAMSLAEEGEITCRALRTEMLECGGDSDFLAKLHCIRQAFQMILSNVDNRYFLIETGRKLLSTLLSRARKNPQKFEDSYDEMMHFLERPEQWPNTEAELLSRGVRHMNFYDVFLDFIVIDSLEDLENPPLSIQTVVKNRWLNSSFKETAVSSSCWSALKQKKQQIKDQTLQFLKDIFDLEKVCYASVEMLSHDILQCLHQRLEVLETYLHIHSSEPVHAPTHVYQPPRPFLA